MNEIFLRKSNGYDALNAIFKTLNIAAPNEQVAMRVDTPIATEHFHIGTKPLAEIIKAGQKILECLKTHPGIYCATIRAEIHNTVTIVYSYEPQHAYSKIRFDNPERANADYKLKLYEALQENFTVLDAPTTSTLVSASNLDVQKYREAVLTDLTSQVSLLGSRLVDSQKQLEDYLQKKVSQLDSEYNDKKGKLETEFRAKENDLAEREKKFQAEKAQFDARDRTVVRRDILKKMEGIIDKRKTISLSTKTNQKRYAVHACFITLFVAVACVAYYFGAELAKQQAFEWRLLAPLSASIAVFVSTMFYYIRWNDQWSKDHARVEFNNIQFEADIFRASWIAELYFEGKEDEKKVVLPSELLKSLTQNMFQDPAASPQQLHSMEQLLSTVSHVSVTKDGVELKK